VGKVGWDGKVGYIANLITAGCCLDYAPGSIPGNVEHCSRPGILNVEDRISCFYNILAGIILITM
jgi:hypothetical protein